MFVLTPETIRRTSQGTPLNACPPSGAPVSAPFNGHRPILANLLTWLIYWNTSVDRGIEYSVGWPGSMLAELWSFNGLAGMGKFEILSVHRGFITIVSREMLFVLFVYV